MRRAVAVVLCVISAPSVMAALHLQGYATLSRSGSTLRSTAAASAVWDEPICANGCAYRLRGTHKITGGNGALIMNVNWFINNITYRVNQDRTVSPGDCFTASNEATFSVTAGQPTVYSPVPTFPSDVLSEGPWLSSTICYQSAPPPPPPPADVCDHCDTTMEPLILDLDGNGILTTSKMRNPVWFDLDGNGALDLTAWTAPGEDDAFLYVDWNGNATIDGGRELFGDVTIMPNGVRARNGFEALSAYDHPSNGGNDDNSITRADRIWSRLRLWVDRNHDGVVTNDENTTLGGAGVVEIPLAFRVMTAVDDYGVDIHGNQHFLQGEYSRREHGRLHALAIHEIYFVVDLH